MSEEVLEFIRERKEDTDSEIYLELLSRGVFITLTQVEQIRVEQELFGRYLSDHIRNVLKHVASL